MKVLGLLLEFLHLLNTVFLYDRVSYNSLTPFADDLLKQCN